jgi:hypothetical protein
MSDLNLEEQGEPEATVTEEHSDTKANTELHAPQFTRGFVFGFLGGCLSLLILTIIGVWYVGTKTQIATDFLDDKLRTQFESKASSIDSRMEKQFSDFQTELLQKLEGYKEAVINQLVSNEQVLLSDLSELFGKSRTTLNDEFQKDLTQTIESIQTTWQKSFETNANALNKLSGDSSSFRAMLSNVEKTQQEIARRVAGLSTESEIQDLLSQAKAVQASDPSLSRLMYLGALAKSPEKYPVLKDFGEWQTRLLQDDLNKEDLISAQDRITAFADILDRYFYLGKFQDLRNYSKMQTQIEKMNSMLFEAQKAIMEKQRTQLDEIIAAVGAFDPDKLNDYITLKGKAEEISPFPELEDEYGSIVQKLGDYIDSSMALQMESDRPLQRPPLMDNEIQAKWLKKVAARLNKKEIPIQTRANDLAFVENQINSMDEGTRATLKSEIKLVQQAAEHIQVENWMNLVESLLATNQITEGDFLNAASELIPPGQRLFESNSTEVKTVLCKLGSAFYQRQLDKVTKNALIIKEQDLGLDDQTIMQAAAASQSQVIQISIEMKSFQGRYECGSTFSELNHKCKELLGTLANIVVGHRLALVDDQRQKENTAKYRFLNWVDEQLNTAENYYEKAKEIADKWGSTWGNDTCQNYLGISLAALYNIDSRSLSIVDSGKYAQYEQIENMVKKKYKDNWIDVYSHSPKKTIQDFKE